LEKGKASYSTLRRGWTSPPQNSPMKSLKFFLGLVGKGSFSLPNMCHPERSEGSPLLMEDGIALLQIHPKTTLRLWGKVGKGETPFPTSFTPSRICEESPILIEKVDRPSSKLFLKRTYNLLWSVQSILLRLTKLAIFSFCNIILWG
jgi:hypothetical protein